MKPALLDFDFAGMPVRAFVDDAGNPWFVAVDVAYVLGYERPHDAVAQHCKGAVKRRIPTAGGRQQALCIPERDLYRMRKCDDFSACSIQRRNVSTKHFMKFTHNRVCQQLPKESVC